VDELKTFVFAEVRVAVRIPSSPPSCQVRGYVNLDALLRVTRQVSKSCLLALSAKIFSVLSRPAHRTA
jgi:hypothetical protein